MTSPWWPALLFRQIQEFQGSFWTNVNIIKVSSTDIAEEITPFEIDMDYNNSESCV